MPRRSGWSPCTRRCAARTPARGRSAFSLVPQLAQDPGVIGPGFAYFHPGAQIHLAAEKLLHVLARRARHALQALTAGAEHDRLLAVALDEDRRLDSAQAALFLEAVDHHLAAVGHVLAHRLEQLLAQELGGEEALVAVGELVGRVRR